MGIFSNHQQSEIRSDEHVGAGESEGGSAGRVILEYANSRIREEKM